MTTNTPKRLALFLPALYGGGAERTMLNLTQGIAERGYAVDLVLALADGAYLANVPKSVNLIDLNASRTLTCLPTLVKYLRNERPDALLSVLHANIIAVWAKRLSGAAVRVVVCEQNTLSVEAQQAEDWRDRMLPHLNSYFYPWADDILAVSIGAADDLAETTGINRNRIKVVHNPVVTPKLREDAQADLDHPWFAPGEPPVFLGVGRLTAQKDFPTLIRAFANVQQIQPSRLLILGEGEERAELEALVRQLDLEHSVSLPGFVANPYAYMSRASIFVLSSRFEGLPTVLIEAMFCGAQLVSTDCPSGPREILRGGQYGQLVPVDDVNALAQAMILTLSSRVSKLPRESWQPYELENVVDQYKRILFGS